MKHVSWTNPRQFLSKAWIIIDFMGLKQKEFILNILDAYESSQILAAEF
jgi:hypothetical protein